MTIAMLRNTEVILATKFTKLRSLAPVLMRGKTLMMTKLVRPDLQDFSGLTEYLR